VGKKEIGAIALIPFLPTLFRKRAGARGSHLPKHMSLPPNLKFLEITLPICGRGGGKGRLKQQDEHPTQGGE